jgi:hypothetical protein
LMKKYVDGGGAILKEPNTDFFAWNKLGVATGDYNTKECSNEISKLPFDMTIHGIVIFSSTNHFIFSNLVKEKGTKLFKSSKYQDMNYSTLNTTWFK